MQKAMSGTRLQPILYSAMLVFCKQEYFQNYRSSYLLWHSLWRTLATWLSWLCNLALSPGENRETIFNFTVCRIFLNPFPIPAQPHFRWFSSGFWHEPSSQPFRLQLLFSFESSCLCDKCRFFYARFLTWFSNSVDVGLSGIFILESPVCLFLPNMF